MSPGHVTGNRMQTTSKNGTGTFNDETKSIMTKEDISHYLPFARGAKTLQDAFRLFQNAEQTEDPTFPRAACIENPGKELIQLKYDYNSIVAHIYEYHPSNVCISLGYRYFHNIEEASIYLFQTAFATEAINALENPENDEADSIDKWKTCISYINLFIERQVFSLSAKVKILEDIVNECSSLNIKVETLKKYSFRLAEKNALEFEELMGISHEWFDYHDPGHWRWALTKMEPSFQVA